VPLTPESIATAFGKQLATAAAPSGTTVQVTDFGGNTQTSPIFYSSPSQVNFELPAGLAYGPAFVSITAANGALSTNEVLILPVSPGLFTLNKSGLAAAILAAITPSGQQIFGNVYQVNSANNVIALPIDLSIGQVYLELYATGLRNAATVTATVGSQSVPVSFNGPQGGYAGLDQVNIGPIPQSLQGNGQTNIVVTADGLTANTVNVTFK
jgi:uncharacterized protein (TIGR03437 family)